MHTCDGCVGIRFVYVIYGFIVDKLNIGICTYVFTSSSELIIYNYTYAYIDHLYSFGLNGVKLSNYVEIFMQ